MKTKSELLEAREQLQHAINVGLNKEWEIHWIKCITWILQDGRYENLNGRLNYEVK